MTLKKILYGHEILSYVTSIKGKKRYIVTLRLCHTIVLVNTHHMLKGKCYISCFCFDLGSYFIIAFHMVWEDYETKQGVISFRQRSSFESYWLFIRSFKCWAWFYHLQHFVTDLTEISFICQYSLHSLNPFKYRYKNWFCSWIFLLMIFTFYKNYDTT